MLTEPDYARLSEALDPKRVKQREGGGGKGLSYIEAHDAIRTANEIFGIGGWGYETMELKLLGVDPISRDGKKGFKAAYSALVKVTIHVGKTGKTDTVTFSDVGYGDGQDYSGSSLTVQELAMKEAVSDGVKRALKNLGDQFGLSLYDKVKRADLEAKQKVAATPLTLKRAVWAIAKERLAKDKPTLADVAALFSVDVADLTEPTTLESILRSEGVL